jgi:rhodanese-related sulfurtransferase
MRRFYSISLFVAFAGISAHAITVAELQKNIAGTNKVTIIDIRDSKLFEQGHIPEAINIPASLCPLKRLPALGAVVVYDDGLERGGKAALSKAAGALAAKPGITVQVLAGGYAAWQSSQAPTTAGHGLHHEAFDYITYPQLVAADASDLLLVDLRKKTETTEKMSAKLTDLSVEFPGRRVAFGVPEQKDSASTPLFVLIDSADGSAEAQARSLKARGIRRFAILAGGEIAIVRKGRRGLARTGNTVNFASHQQKPNLPEPAK